MHTIKKYANRKLYHTNQKQYITLDGIAKLVQDGEVVRVLDNESGEDITPSILAQVVLQARGRSSAQLPTQLLTGLIQVGGDTISNLRRNVASYLGGGDLIDGEIERRIAQLEAQGEVGPDEAERWRHLLTGREFAAIEPHEPITAEPHELHDHAVPSRSDVARLHTQVDALTAIVDQLLRQRGP